MILEISAFGPSITEQCKKANVVATGKSLELIERLSHAITLCHIHGVLTDSECDRARTRLIKAARFQKREE